MKIVLLVLMPFICFYSNFTKTNDYRIKGEHSRFVEGGSGGGPREEEGIEVDENLLFFPLLKKSINCTQLKSIHYLGDKATPWRANEGVGGGPRST